MFVHERLFSIVHEHSLWVVHEQQKNPLHQQNRWWSGFFCRSWTCFLWPSLNKIVCQEPLFTRSWTAVWHCSSTCVHSPLMNTPKFEDGLPASWLICIHTEKCSTMARKHKLTGNKKKNMVSHERAHSLCEMRVCVPIRILSIKKLGKYRY